MNAFALNGILVAITCIPLAILITVNASRDKARWLIALFTFAVSIWGWGGFLIAREQDPAAALFYWRLTHVGVIMIPAFLFHFILVFLEKKNRGPLLFLNYGFAALFEITNLSGHFIKYVRYVFNQFYYDSPPTILYTVFFLYFVLIVVVSHYWLIRAFFKAEGQRRKEIQSVLLGAGLGFAGGTPSFLPVFGIDVYPFLNFTVVLFPTFVAIGVFKYRLLKIKVIATELLTVLIMLVLLIQVFLAKTLLEVFLRIAFFVIVGIFGYLLIKSVSSEVERREELQFLAEQLRISNQELGERNLFLNALQDITSLITRTLDFKKVTQEIVDGIYTKLRYQGGVMMLLSQDLKRLHPISFSKTPFTGKVIKLLPLDPFDYAADFEKHDTLSVRAIKDSQIQVSDKLSRFISPPIPETIADAIQKIALIRTVVAVPVFSEDSIIGVIDFFLAKSKNEIHASEFQTMQALANQAGIVTRNLALYDQIQAANNQLEVANEKLKELDKTKSEFISVASHQLRTPMTIIKGYVSLIMEGQYGKTGKPIKVTLQKIFDSVNRLISLVNDLLSISRIEAGRMTYGFKPMEMNAMVKDVCGELELNAKNKKLALTCSLPKQPVTVNADAEKLRQVLVNLIDNAIKYTAKGYVKVSLKRVDHEAIFEVTDSGIGIDPKDKNKLFEKFSRGSQTLTSTGTGLGLFVGRKIIDAHGGEIGVDSRGKGKGSRFYFTLKVIS